MITESERNQVNGTKKKILKQSYPIAHLSIWTSIEKI
jgi:hypothetical protein